MRDYPSARQVTLQTRWRTQNGNGICCSPEVAVPGIFPRSVVSMNGLVVPVHLGDDQRLVHSSTPIFVSVHFISGVGFSHPIPIWIPSNVEVLDRFGWPVGECLSIVSFEPCSRIEHITFSGGSRLKSICIPSSLEILCENCFSKCWGLESLTFEPNSKLSRIERHAIFHARRLPSLLIPSPVVHIDAMALPHGALLTISMDEENRHFTTIGGFIVTFGVHSLVHYFGWETEAVIPASVVTLRPHCLAGHSRVSTVRFEAGSELKHLGPLAFSGCSSLKSICLSPSVETIGEKCFFKYEGLSSFTVEPDSKLARIEKSAFDNCVNLRSVFIPSSVEILCESCFSGCKCLSTLSFEDGSRLTRIEKDAFSCCHQFLTSVEIPSSFEILGDGCFFGCCSLSSFTFEPGSKLARIEKSAFAHCSKLESICIPSSVESLGEDCFLECESLCSFTVEAVARLARIEKSAFA
jgi:hypothetical protein